MPRRLTGLLATVALGLAMTLGASPATALPPFSPTRTTTRTTASSRDQGPRPGASVLVAATPGGTCWTSRRSTSGPGGASRRPGPWRACRYDRAPWSPTIIAALRFPGWLGRSETHALT